MDRFRDTAEFVRKYDEMASAAGADPISVYREAISEAASSLVQADAISAQGYFSGKIRKLISDAEVKV